MDHVPLRYKGPLPKMCWIHWLVWNMKSLNNVPCFKDTPAPINAEMNGGRTLGALSSHGLIEVHCHFGLEELPKSHKALEMVPLEQSKWVLKLRLLSHGLNVKIKLGMEWSDFTIWIPLNRGHGDHNDGFRRDFGRTLRIGRGLSIRLCLSRRLSKAWGPSPLS